MAADGAAARTSAISGASIRISRLEKRFGRIVAVRDFSIDIAAGEFVSVLGASGSGKTTVLRMLAGLEEPTSGEIRIDGRVATDLPPERRDIGLVFQDYALFPHMTASDNIAFPLRMRKVPKAEIAGRVNRIMELVGAGHLGDRRPSELSGGQQQRVALARALVFGPKLLLLDEPLSALDKNLREHMKAEIKLLHRRTGVTVIYVTHDQSEALALSDRIVVMREGQIIAADAPDTLYSRPSSSYLAGFIGDANLIPAVVSGIDGNNVSVTCALGGFRLPSTQLVATKMIAAGQNVDLVARPENILVLPPPSAEGVHQFSGCIDEALYNGANTIYSLTVPGFDKPLGARSSMHCDGAVGAGKTVALGLKLDSLVILPREE